MSDGGITVSKVSTGVHLIADIGINVGHKEITYIPAELVVASKDLHRALNSRVIFQLVSSMPQHTQKPLSVGENLSQENQQLREALAKANLQGEALKVSMAGLEQKLDMLMGAVTNISQVSTTNNVVVSGSKSDLVTVPSVVGGEVPMFLPTDLVRPECEIQLNIKTEESTGTSISGAQARLRQIRGKS